MFQRLFSPGKRQFIHQLWKLAWPISVQTFVASALTLVDVVMVSELGETPLAAVGLINRLYFVIIIALVGFASGAGALATQFAGRRDYGGVAQTLSLMIRGAALLTLPLSLGLGLFAMPLMQLLTDNPDIQQLGAAYLAVTSPVHVLTALVFSYATVSRALGDSRLPMVVSVGALLVNSVLNALLIFGLGPLPAMGVVGAALATLIARSLECLLLASLFYRRFSLIALTAGQLLMAIPAWLWRRFMGLALPFMVQGMLWAAGVFAYNLIYARMGAAALAVMSLLAPVEGLMVDLFVGLSGATAIIVGRSLGQERYTAARVRASFVTRHAPWPAAVVALVTVVVLLPLLAITSLSPVAQSWATAVMLLYLVLLPVKVYTMLISTAVLRAGGDSRGIVVVDNICLWLVGLPLAFYLAMALHLTLPWVFAAVLVEEGVKAILFTVRKRQGFWLKSQIHE